MNARASHYSGCSSISHSRLKEHHQLEGKRSHVAKISARTTLHFFSIQMEKTSNGSHRATSLHRRTWTVVPSVI
jgi:hypothetical protein